MDPEKIISYEIGYLGYFFNNSLEIDVRFAREEIEDVIDRTKTGTRLSDTDPRFAYANYGEIDIDSVEMQLTYKPASHAFFKLNASYAEADGYNASKLTVDGLPEKAGYNVDEHVPTWTTGALFSYKFSNNLRTSIQYNYVDAYKTEGDGSDLGRMESTDIKIAKTFDLDGSYIDISGIVRNISDNDYEDFNDNNLVGMETYFQIKLGLD